MANAKNGRSEDMPADVQKLQERFARWRENKEAAAEPIPARLWEAAVKLCRTYRVSQLSRWLRLHHTTLQKRASRRSSPRSSRLRPNFVEWNLPAGNSAGVSSAEYVVEAPVGEDATQRVHVRGASVSEVAALALALRAGREPGLTS